MDLLMSTKSCKIELCVKYKQFTYNIQTYISDALRMFSIPYLHDSIFKTLPC